MTKITVCERAGKSNVPWPVTFVLPCKRGEVISANPPLCLWDDQGETVPIKMNVISRFWADADQSVRLLAVTFVCAGLPSKGTRVFELRRGNPRLLDLGKNSFLGGFSLNGELLSPGAAGDKPGLMSQSLHLPGHNAVLLDAVLVNNRFDRRQGAPFLVKRWTIKAPHVAVYQSAYVPAPRTGETTTLLSNCTLPDMAGFWRRILIAEKPDPARDATFLRPPVAVIEAKAYVDARHSAWGFDRMPAITYDAKPALHAKPPLTQCNPRDFWLIDMARAKNPNQTGGWPYPDAEFIATGAPAHHERIFDHAIAGCFRLPQAVNGYRHAEHWSTVGLDPAPNGGGNLRDFKLGASKDVLKASDDQHGWLHYIWGAYAITGDPILADWLKGMAQARIATIRNLTKWPDQAERARAHAFTMVQQGWLVDGDPDAMQAMRTMIAQFSRPEGDPKGHKGQSRRHGLWFGSFKTAYLMRAFIAFMIEVGPNDPDYWRCWQYLGRAAEWNHAYGNFCYQGNTTDFIKTKPESSPTSLTWPDPLAWYVENFHGHDKRLWDHLRAYMGAKLGLGPYPTGANWKAWKGAFEGRYYIDAAKRLNRRAAASWSTGEGPLVKALPDVDGHTLVEITPHKTTTKLVVLRAKRPIADWLNPDPTMQNWFAADAMYGQCGAAPFSLSVESRMDGSEWHHMIITWDAEGRRAVQEF